MSRDVSGVHGACTAIDAVGHAAVDDGHAMSLIQRTQVIPDDGMIRAWSSVKHHDRIGASAFDEE